MSGTDVHDDDVCGDMESLKADAAREFAARILEVERERKSDGGQ